MRIPAIVTAVLSLAITACGDDSVESTSMEDRAIALADSVDALTTSVSHHMAPVLAADSIAEINDIEADHYADELARLDTVDYWIGQLQLCVEDHNQPPDTAFVEHLAETARRTAALHRFAMALAGDLESAAGEEFRYQGEMLQHMTAMRSQHIYMEGIASGYTCPPLPTYGDLGLGASPPARIGDWTPGDSPGDPTHRSFRGVEVAHE